MANELNYVNYDFDSLVQQLIDRVKLRDAWKDTYRSSTGQMLIELYAYVANLVLYYIERRASEQYISTAKLRSSIINLVKLLNYTPKRKVSAKGKLRFSIDSPIEKRIFIPKYTECQTAAGIKYLTLQDVVLLPGQTFVDVNAIQGSLVQTSYVSDGSLNLEIKINDTNVENDNVFIYVAGELWEKVESFVFSINTSKHYRIIPELDDTLTIRFGDNVFGMAPIVGSEILIQYIRSDGLIGNVYELGKINTINSAIFDEDNNRVNLSVSNIDLFLGGDDEEDTEEIRFEAPRVFKTGDRAVTREDFIALLENYPGVANANVWGEMEENPPNYNMFNRVKLVVLLQDWQLPSISFKQELTSYLYKKSMLTVKYEFVNPEIVNVVPVLRIKAKKDSTLSVVKMKTEETLKNEFVLGKTTKLGINKRFSDIVLAIEEVDGVAYHYLNLYLRKDLNFGFDSYYSWGANLNLLPVESGSVEVYIANEKVAIDNGIGGFVSLTSDYAVTGIVNYFTGYLGIDISPSPPSGDSVYVLYKQKKDGDLVVNSRQILKLYEVKITDISYV